MSSAEQQGISVDVDHNPYLAEGSGTVDAIVSITAAMTSRRRPQRRNGSRPSSSTARRSMQAPIGQVRRGETGHRRRDRRTRRRHATSRSSRGTEKAVRVYPRRRAADAGERGDQGGGDARRRRPAAQRRHRDGHLARVRPRQSSDTARARSPTRSCSPTARTSTRPRKNWARRSALSEGEFTCDCRGVGTDWQVDELRSISSALLGTVDIVADPDDLAEDFAAMMRTSMGKSIPDLTLRLWTPAGARVEFVKQVAPTVEDLTHRRVDAGNQMRGVPAGLLGCRGPRLSRPGRGRTRRGRPREAGRAGECRCGRPGSG